MKTAVVCLVAILATTLFSTGGVLAAVGLVPGVAAWTPAYDLAVRAGGAASLPAPTQTPEPTATPPPPSPSPTRPPLPSPTPRPAPPVSGTPGSRPANASPTVRTIGATPGPAVRVGTP